MKKYFFMYIGHVKSFCEIWIAVVTIKKPTHSADIDIKFFLCELEVGEPFSI
jgi:hypothetical protein